MSWDSSPLSNNTSTNHTGVGWMNWYDPKWAAELASYHTPPDDYEEEPDDLA